MNPTTDTATTQESIAITTPDSSGNFRYDSTGHQWIYNFGTKSLKLGWYTLDATLGDGADIKVGHPTHLVGGSRAVPLVITTARPRSDPGPFSHTTEVTHELVIARSPAVSRKAPSHRVLDGCDR